MYGKLYYVVKGVAAYDSVTVLTTKKLKRANCIMNEMRKGKLTVLKARMQIFMFDKEGVAIKTCEPLERLVHHGQQQEHHNEQCHRQNLPRTLRRLG
jgi:hypothetical protein